jgi:FecR protein
MRDAHDPRDPIGQLLKLAGRRPLPDPTQTMRARDAARAEWTHLVQRRRWRLWRFTLAAAAALGIGVSGLTAWAWLHGGAPLARVDVARVHRISGTILVSSGRERASEISAQGTRLRTGDRMETTGTSRVAFTLDSGESVRLDRNTVAVLESARRLTLTRGAVYIDSGGQPADSGLQVSTSHGTVRHIGTRFEVRLLDSSLRVRVRDGAVAIDARNRTWTSHAGDGLLFVRDREPERQAITAFGPDWSWISELAEPFRLEGATVLSFLEWVSAEQGRGWRFENASTESRAGKIVLHGSIDGLSADEALAAVLPTAGLSARLKDDLLIVSAPLHPR